MSALEAEAEGAEGRSLRAAAPTPWASPAAALGVARFALPSRGRPACRARWPRRSACVREREAAPAPDLLVAEPERGDHLDLRPVVHRERDQPGVGAEQLAAFAERDLVHGIGGDGARERGGEALQAGGARAGDLGSPPRLGLRRADGQTVSICDTNTARLMAFRLSVHAEAVRRAARSSTSCATIAAAAATRPGVRPRPGPSPSTTSRKTMAGVVVATRSPECGASSAVATTTPTHRPP